MRPRVTIHFAYLRMNRRFTQAEQSFVTNALKNLMDQLEERILQTDQLKNASKRLQHRVDRTHSLL